MEPAFVRNHFCGDDLSSYLAAHTTPPDELSREHRRTTAASLGNRSVMQIGDDQAVFMEILVRSIGARRAIEIGTFTGASAMAIARGLGPEGHLLCCDVNEEWTAIAREYWQRAGLFERIELRIGPAIETLRALPADELVDFVFIDADKPANMDYYETVLPHVRRDGLILIDNTLSRGAVLDATRDDHATAELRRFNDHVVGDARVLSVLLPIGDGITVAQKR